MTLKYILWVGLFALIAPGAAGNIYGDQHRRLIEERLNLNATNRWTNSFAFDEGTAGQAGILTTAGAPNSSVIERLFDLCAKPVEKTRGFHECPFCPTHGEGRQCSRNGKSIWLGSAIVWFSTIRPF